MSNLLDMYYRADEVDRREGRLAYQRYGMVLRNVAKAYGFDFARVVAAFVACSPNNDYVGNLRCVVTLCATMRAGLSYKDCRLSCYRHCGQRAWYYLAGEVDFLSTAKGLKIINFYHNIMCPEDPRWVTIDGHMVATYRGMESTMKDSIVRPPMYEHIKREVVAIAGSLGVVPNIVQATIWFARKRVLKVRYSPQLSLWHATDDQWQTLHDVARIEPFYINWSAKVD